VPAFDNDLKESVPMRLSPPTRCSPHPLALAIALALSLSAVLAPSARAANGAATGVAVDVPAQPLGQALNELARQAGLQLSFPATLVAGKTSAPVSGRMPAQQALDRMLAASGMVATVENGAAVVRPAPHHAPGSLAVPVVTVTGRADRPVAPSQEQGYRSRRATGAGFREQDLLDTPYSNTVIGAEVMRDQLAKSLIDVVKNDPSVTPSDNPHWYDRVTIRGFNLGVDSIYRDGLSINDQGSIALENKAAVEINKGLSALRYGVTSPGGTVNYALKRPTDEDLRIVHLTADEYGGFGLHADLGGRVGEQGHFGYRINLAGERLRSHVDPYRGEKRFASGFFDWRIGQRLRLEFDLEHQRLDKLSVRMPSLWWWGWDEGPAAVAAAQASFSRLDAGTYAYQDWAMEPNRQTQAGVRAHYQINDAWKASFAVHQGKLERDQNSGGVWTTVGADGEYEAEIYYSPDQERNNRSMQLVVQGDVQHGGLRHELAFGADSVRRDMTWSNGVNIAIGFDNIFAPRGLPRPSLRPADAGPALLQNRVRQASWFLTDTLVLNERWRMFGGLRHTSLKQYGGATATTPVRKQYDESALNPNFGLMYKPHPQATFYASYAEGIEQGGVVNDPSYTNDGEILAPLESQQLEVGAKWEAGADALLTLALFEIDKGLEIDRNNGNGTRTRVQDGRQVHRGVELTGSGQLTRDLKLIAGAAYLRPQIDKTDNAVLAGKKPRGIPNWQGNLYVDYSLQRWLPGLSVNGGIYASGRKAIDQRNLWMASGYVRFDAGLKYAQVLAGGQEMVYRLTVNNLADKRYLANTTSGSLQFGAPRSILASASLQF
jgi:iron complex outermembrane receptor protein